VCDIGLSFRKGLERARNRFLGLKWFNLSEHRKCTEMQRRGLKRALERIFGSTEKLGCSRTTALIMSFVRNRHSS
jgi:hypothetical protein